LVGDAERLHSLDTETGDKYWSVDTPAGFSSSPVVQDDTIVGTSSGRGYGQGSVFAIGERPTSSADEAGRWTAEQLRALISLGVTGLIGGLALLSWRSQSGSDVSDGSSNEDSTLTVDDVLDMAEEAVELAEDTAAEGDYESALDHYQTAVNEYQTTLERTTDETVIEDSEAMIADLRDKQRNIRDQIEARSNISNQLEAAEEALNEAVIAHVEGRSTLAGIRYRQARENYEGAIELAEESEFDVFETPLSMSIDVGENLSYSMDGIEWLDNETKEALANAGVETFEEFRTTDFEEISFEEISGDHDARLRALFWLIPLDSIVFSDPDKIRARRDYAQLGFDSV